jgi:hypothetical protein
MEPVRENALMELGDGERLCEILRMLRAHRPHEMTEHPIEVIHADKTID